MSATLQEPPKIVMLNEWRQFLLASYSSQAIYSIIVSFVPYLYQPAKYMRHVNVPPHLGGDKKCPLISYEGRDQKCPPIAYEGRN